MKVCNKCGEEKDYALFGKNKLKKDGLTLWCKDCISINANRYRINNLERYAKYSRAYWSDKKELKKEANSKYAKENPEKKRESHRKSVLKNPEKRRSIARRNDSNSRLLLSDSYIKQNFTKYGFPKDQITPELIEVKRLIIKTKRLCKTLQN